MELIWQGIVKAVELVFGFDREVWAITWLYQNLRQWTLISLLLGILWASCYANTVFGRSLIGRW